MAGESAISTANTHPPRRPSTVLWTDPRRKACASHADPDIIGAGITGPGDQHDKKNQEGHLPAAPSEKRCPIVNPMYSAPNTTPRRRPNSDSDRAADRRETAGCRHDQRSTEREGRRRATAGSSAEVPSLTIPTAIAIVAGLPRKWSRYSSTSASPAATTNRAEKCRAGDSVPAIKQRNKNQRGIDRDDGSHASEERR